MGKFSKIFHHIESKDLRNKYEQKKVAKIKEQKKLQEEIIRNVKIKKYAASAMEQVKYNWRSTFDSGAALREGMTTSDVATISVPPKEGDGVVSTVDAIDSTSYATQITDLFGDGVNRDGNVGSVIRNSGSGTGQNGGFDVGGQYLSFQGNGYNDTGHALRWAGLAPIDSTEVDTLEITAIVGNDSNGGEDPDAPGEELYVMYQTPAMSQPQFLIQNPDGSIAQGKSASSTDDVIIPLGAANNSGLNKYAVQIPAYARAEGTQFILIQVASSGTGFDNYGITNINFQRKTPVNVVVPLDNPQASSFIRGADEGSSPKKRKKDVNDKLEASDEYTQATFGNEFPGQEVRVGGEDPFKGAEIGDDVEPSPIGRTEVAKTFSRFADSSDEKKSFGDFNNQTPTASTTQSEPEPEPTTPSTQTTMAPTSDDGEPIPVKNIGAKSVGVVQGADAANLDTQEPEPEPTQSSIIQTPEPIDPKATEPKPEDINLSDDEKEGLSPEQQKEKEEEKKQNWFQKTFGKVIDYTKEFLDNILFSLDDVKGVDDILGWVSNAIMTSAGGVFQMLEQIPGIDMEYVSGGSTAGKMHNNISIFRSVISGKVINHVPTVPELQLFRNYITPDLFTEGHRSYVPISSVRHEYADKNIYVLDGKVYNNREEGATDLTDGKEFGKYLPVNVGGYVTNAPEGIGGHGTGYAQMIIPEDGSEPYLHYYDYNYHNLKNPDDLPGGIGRATTSVGSDVAHFLGLLMKVPHGGVSRAAALAQQKFIDKFNNLGNEKSFLGEGWPEGIHGAALTDFKVPLKSLPESTQKYIASHPLSWTPERMENMSEEYLYEQLDILLEKEGIVYRDSDSGDSYFKGIIKILNTKGINADPKFVKAFTGIDETWKKGQELDKEYKEIPKKPGFGLAFQKAGDAWKSLLDDRKKATEREELNKYISKNVKIPNPETDGDDRPDWGEWINSKEGKRHDQLQAEQKKLNDAASDYYRTTTQPAANKFFAYQDTLERKGNKVVGTDEQIKKFIELKTAYENASNEYDRLFALQDKPMMEADALLSAFIEDYDRRMAIWKPYLEEIDRVYRGVVEAYQPLIDEAYEKYTITHETDENGKYVNGGDYTDENGKTYPGYGTFYEDIDTRIAENNELADQYWDTYSSYGYRYLAETIDPFLVNKQFKGKTIDWTPGKKGTGNIPGGYRSDGAQSQPRGYSYGGFDASFAGSGGGRSGRRNDRRRGTAFQESNLYERLKNKSFFNPDDIKPEFPENPPPKLDPKTGMHPEYGKKAKRYGKLDPISANSMPLTGDPEIDAVVKKQKTINRIKKMARNK